MRTWQGRMGWVGRAEVSVKEYSQEQCKCMLVVLISGSGSEDKSG